MTYLFTFGNNAHFVKKLWIVVDGCGWFWVIMDGFIVQHNFLSKCYLFHLCYYIKLEWQSHLITYIIVISFYVIPELSEIFLSKFLSQIKSKQKIIKQTKNWIIGKSKDELICVDLEKCITNNSLWQKKLTDDVINYWRQQKLIPVRKIHIRHVTDGMMS